MSEEKADEKVIERCVEGYTQIFASHLFPRLVIYGELENMIPDMFESKDALCDYLTDKLQMTHDFPKLIEACRALRIIHDQHLEGLIIPVNRNDLETIYNRLANQIFEPIKKYRRLCVRYCEKYLFPNLVQAIEQFNETMEASDHYRLHITDVDQYSITPAIKSAHSAAFFDTIHQFIPPQILQLYQMN